MDNPVYKKIRIFIGLLIIQLALGMNAMSQELKSPGLSLSEKSNNSNELSLYDKSDKSNELSPVQRPFKHIYYTGGVKLGMFFVQGNYRGNQMIAIEPYGKYVGEDFFAELSLPIRFKTSPAFTDIGLDINVLYPFLGRKNKSEFDPYVGGGMGLHFIGKDDGGPDSVSITARGGLGVNVILGVEFFKNYDFNVIAELKYFYYLREFGDKTYNGIGLNIGVTLPHSER